MKQLLSLLSDGEFHSGTDVGRLLGVSRTAVWKHLQALEELGLSVEAIKGKGYRVKGGIELLEAKTIDKGLSAAVSKEISHIDICSQVDSTNAQLLALQASRSVHGYICLAEYQSAGRGRRGRQWVSPFACNIYFSLGWEFSGGADQLEGLSLVVGVNLAEVLQSLGMDNVQLKWPNDILIAGEKVGGVLLEMVGDPSGLCTIIVGIGLNVNMPQDTVIDQPYTSLSSHSRSVSRNDLIIRILNQLVPMLQNFQRQGFAPYQSQWQKLDAFYNKPVNVIYGHQVEPLVGVARGVLPNGALCIVADDQEHHICGGEVSLRGQ